MKSSLRVISALFLLPGLLFAHAGGRDIRGTIVRIEKDSVVVKRVDGVRETVRLASTTTYRVGDAEGTWADSAPAHVWSGTSRTTAKRSPSISRRGSKSYFANALEAKPATGSPGP